MSGDRSRRHALRGRPFKTTVIAKRLAFIEEEHASMARLWSMMTDDMIGLRDSQPRQDERIGILVGLVATIVQALGAEQSTTAIWVLAMIDDDAIDRADEFASYIVEQLMLVHQTPAGEA